MNCNIHLLVDSSALRNKLEMYETLDIGQRFKHYFPLSSVDMESFLLG